MQKLDLPINTQVPVHLQSLDGELVPSRFGPSGQVKFTSEDGRVVYVPPFVADQVKQLGSRFVCFCKARPAHGGKIAWQVKPGEQRDGTFVIPKEEKPESALTNPGLPAHPTSNQSSLIESTIPAADPARKGPITADSIRLVDTFAVVQEYAAEKYRGRVDANHVLRIVLTAYIQHGRTGARR